MTLPARLSTLLHSNLVLALLALLGGLLAAAGGRQFLQQRARELEADVARRYTLSPVVVAKRDLPAGERLGPEAMAVRAMPTEYLPSGSIAGSDAAMLVGRRLASDLKRGEALQLTSLQPDRVSLSTVLPPGIRALTLAVDDLNSHAGLLRAGDSVDVYLVERLGERSRIGLLQERLLVLATGSRAPGQQAPEREGVATDFGTVTLRVDDRQAQRLLLAQQAGELSFVLRAEADESPAVARMLDSRFLLEPGPSTGAGRSGSRRVTDAVELLVGGGGGPAPRRQWLRVALPGQSRGGE